jgi:hypothetical protein
LQILQNGYSAVQALRQSTDALNNERVLLLLAMGKVEPRNIHASPHQLFEPLLAIRSRANGTDNLGTTHG